MNRIVKEHYPAENLPEDLRVGLAPGARVTVTIEADALAGFDDEWREQVSALLRPPPRAPTLDEIFALRRPTFKTVEEIDDHVRRLRDEWD